MTERFPSNLNCRGLGHRDSSELTTDDQFAKMVPGEEKLQGRRALEQLFQSTVVEILALLVNGTRPGHLQQSLPILDAVVVDRDGRCLLVRAEEEQQMRPGPQGTKKLVGGLLNHRRTEKLKGVPDKHRIERSFGK